MVISESTINHRNHRFFATSSSATERELDCGPSCDFTAIGVVSGHQPVMIWLVVEPTPLKNMRVSWDDDIPN